MISIKITKDGNASVVEVLGIIQDSSKCESSLMVWSGGRLVLMGHRQ